MKTIAAVSTPRGKGGIAVIRISGDTAFETADLCFIPKSGVKLSQIKPRTAVYGTVIDINNDGESADDAVAVAFAAPNSFTGEDTVEISCHGGIAVTRKVLECVFACGAEAAMPGEFTRRAFINGKLSLTRAEAVGQLIESETEAQRKLALSQSRGILSNRIEQIRNTLVSAIAKIYAVIDYPEEELPEPDREFLAQSIEMALDNLKKLAATYKTGKAVTDGVVTAIIGKPNAGKSSLYNCLCGSDRAIVTDIAGTTRDILETSVSVGDVKLILLDTAGIRSADDAVEKIGIERAVSSAAEAALIIAVFDGSRPFDGEDSLVIDALVNSNAKKIAVINKSDIADAEFHLPDENIFDEIVTISALNEFNSVSSDFTESGIQSLCRVINDMYTDGSIDISNDAVISEARQFASVSRAADDMERALQSLRIGESPDIICFCAESALAQLDMTDGRSVSEDIVSEIFSKFCVGK